MEIPDDGAAQSPCCCEKPFPRQELSSVVTLALRGPNYCCAPLSRIRMPQHLVLYRPELLLLYPLGTKSCFHCHYECELQGSDPTLGL